MRSAVAGGGAGSAGRAAGSAGVGAGAPLLTRVATVMGPAAGVPPPPHAVRGAAVVGVGDEREPAGPGRGDEHVRAAAGGQDEAIVAGRRAQVGAVVGDLYERVALQP